MPDFEVGNGYLNLVGEAAGFKQDAERKLAAIDLEKDVQLDADITRVEGKIRQVQSRLEQLQRQKTNPQIDLDSAAVQARIQQVQQRLEALGRMKPSPKVDADTASATAKLNSLQQRLQEIEGRRANVSVDADIASAMAQLARLQAQLDRLNGQKANVEVGADGAAATLAQINGVQSAANRLNGTQARINLTGPRLPDIQNNLYAIVAALGLVGAAAGPAAAALSAIPAAAAGAAQVGAVISASFAGVDTAIDAVNKQNQLMAAGFDASSKKGKAAAEAVKIAMAGLSQEQQKFVRFWTDEWTPAWQKVTEGLGDQFLPKFTTALRTVSGVFPTLQAGLRGTATELGNLAMRGADMLNSGPWKADFATIMERNNGILRIGGDALLNFGDGLRNITIAGQPVLQSLTEMALRGSETFKGWAQGARDSGALQAQLEEWGKQLQRIIVVLGEAAGKIWNEFLPAIAPLGMALVEATPGAVELMTALANLVVQGLGVMAPVIKPLLELLVQLADQFNDLPPGVQGAIGAFLLFPRVLRTVMGAFSLLAGSVTGTVAIIRGLLTGGLAGAFAAASATATREGRNAGTGFSNGISSGGAAAAGNARNVGNQAGAGLAGGWRAGVGGLARFIGGAAIFTFGFMAVDAATGGDPLAPFVALVGSINQYITGEPLTPAQNAWQAHFGRMSNTVREAMGLARLHTEDGTRQISSAILAQAPKLSQPFITEFGKIPVSAQQAMKQTMDNLINTANGRGPDLRVAGDAIVFGLTQPLNQLPPAGQRAGQGATANLLGGLAPAPGGAGAAGRGAYDQFLAGVNPIPGAGQQAGQGGTNGLTGGLAPAPGNAGAAGGNANAAWGGGIAGIGPAATDAGRQGTDNLRNGLNQAAPPAGTAGRSAMEAFGAGLRSVAAGIAAWVGQFVMQMVRALNSIGVQVGGGYSNGGMVGYHLGGVVGSAPGRGYALGGGGSPKPGPSDTVPALLTPGEYVSTRRTVNLLGADYFAALSKLTRSQAEDVRSATAVALSGGSEAAAAANARGRGSAVSAAAQRAPIVRSAERSPALVGGGGGEQPLIGQYNHYAGGGETFQEGLESVMYRTRQARRGGVG